MITLGSKVGVARTSRKETADCIIALNRKDSASRWFSSSVERQTNVEAIQELRLTYCTCSYVTHCPLRRNGVNIASSLKNVNRDIRHRTSDVALFFGTQLSLSKALASRAMEGLVLSCSHCRAGGIKGGRSSDLYLVEGSSTYRLPTAFMNRLRIRSTDA